MNCNSKKGPDPQPLVLHHLRGVNLSLLFLNKHFPTADSCRDGAPEGSGAGVHHLRPRVCGQAQVAESHPTEASQGPSVCHLWILPKGGWVQVPTGTPKATIQLTAVIWIRIILRIRIHSPRSRIRIPFVGKLKTSEQIFCIYNTIIREICPFSQGIFGMVPYLGSQFTKRILHKKDLSHGPPKSYFF